MAYKEFINNLRYGSRMLPPPNVSTEGGGEVAARYKAILTGADLWLTPKVVEGYDPADFLHLSTTEQRELDEEVSAFRAIAEEIPPDKPATSHQSKEARKHLEKVIKLVRGPILARWLKAQAVLMEEAKEAAKEKGWYTEMQQKRIDESLLGTYQAPRLLIRNVDGEVFLNPVAYFGSGNQGVVDVVASPTFETAYYLTFSGEQWQIVPSRGTAQKTIYEKRFRKNFYQSLQVTKRSAVTTVWRDLCMIIESYCRLSTS